MSTPKSGRILALTGLALALASAVEAGPVTITSPDGRNAITVDDVSGALRYSVVRDGHTVLASSPMGLVLNDDTPFGTTIGGLTATGADLSEGVDDYALVVGKTAHVNAPYRAARLSYASTTAGLSSLSVEVRAYDQGIAFRYSLPPLPAKTTLRLQREATGFNFAADYDCWGLNQGRFENSFEGEYDPLKASDARVFHLFQSPFLCRTPEGEVFALAESNLENYPGAYYAGRGDGGYGLEVVLTPRHDSDRGLRFSQTAATVDATSGFNTAWRIVMLGESEGELIENTLITNLAAPSRVSDTSWIKPGLVAWDWWNGSQVELPAGQSPGMNTATYKAFVDHAAAMGLDYILIDEGWSVGSSVEPRADADPLTPKPEMDMPAIIAYAKSKGVKVWIWLQWQQLSDHMDSALAAYESWGIAGIKVDFMNRNDQEMIGFYHRLLGTAAKHHIMVDLHGAFPPAGLSRTYPHYLTQEGVLGAENNKWSRRITASHNVELAYTRMLAGPMDYTPGAFRHVTPEAFPAHQSFINPVVMTTRAQTLGMYVVYDSPLQMVSDAPAAYHTTDGGWQPGADFLMAVPSSWDETVYLGGDITSYVAIARRKGNVWYIGAINNEAERSIEVPLSRLKLGKATFKLWQDGAEISDLITSEGELTDQSATLSLRLKANGGAAAIITPVPATRSSRASRH